MENGTGFIGRRDIPGHTFKDMNEVLDAVGYFKDLLQLSEWSIHVSVAGLKDMPDKNVIGACKADHAQRQAWIRLLNDAEYEPEDDDMYEFNMLYTLIHEMLHIPMEALAVPKELEKQEEWVINSVALAMMKLYLQAKN
jgi:hypothetical protein